jgi:hypothetical protein
LFSQEKVLTCTKVIETKVQAAMLHFFRVLGCVTPKQSITDKGSAENAVALALEYGAELHKFATQLKDQILF